MKPLYNEDYYRENWDRFMKKVPGKHYVDLEGDLHKLLDDYREVGVPEEAIKVICKAKAKEIADRCKALVLEELEVVKRIEAGEASFGMTTRRQEIEYRHDYRTRFDFNCLQLADFKKKYQIN